jgi:hypothetical protein
MRINKIFLLAAAILIFTSPGRAAEEYSISAIKAHLYYHERGQFDDEDLFVKEPILRNVIIGEGETEGPSAAILVLVEVSGPSFGYGLQGQLKVRIETSLEVLFDGEAPLNSFFTIRGKVFYPFLVYGTGCQEVTITANLSGGELDPAPMEKKIPFRCGE